MNDDIPPTVRAWDPLVRIFHWSLVFFVLLTFVTEDDWMSLHIQAGYAVLYLLGFRVIWGFVGTRTARFVTFIRSPAVVLEHLRGMLTLKAGHYLGHNPVAAVMVLMLLVSLGMVCFTGLVTIASEGRGPLADTLFAGLSGEWMEEVHEFLANFTLLLIAGHIAGVVLSSLLEGENLVRAMITGKKKWRERWRDDDSCPGGDGNA